MSVVHELETEAISDAREQQRTMPKRSTCSTVPSFHLDGSPVTNASPRIQDHGVLRTISSELCVDTGRRVNRIPLASARLMMSSRSSPATESMALETDTRSVRSEWSTTMPIVGVAADGPLPTKKPFEYSG